MERRFRSGNARSTGSLPQPPARLARRGRGTGLVALLALLGAGLGGTLPASPASAMASEQEALRQMAQGRQACRHGQYAAGVKALLDGAVALQQANPRHPANRRWLPQVRRCLASWIRAVGKRCRRTGQVAQLRALAGIQKTMRYLSAPSAKRLLQAIRRRCLGDVVRLHVRQCVDAPSRNQVSALTALDKTLSGFGASRALRLRLGRGRDRCARRLVADLESRCKSAPGISTLREMGRAVTALSGKARRAAQAAYEGCAQALARSAWALCQARRYLKGRALLREAIARYGFFGATGGTFLRRARQQWLPSCGTWRITGLVVARSRVRGAALRIQARLDYLLARTGRPDRSLVGELRVRYSGLRGRRSGCRVLITPQDGRYPLSGREQPTRLLLRPDVTVPAVPASEELQLTCGHRLPVLQKLRLLGRLIRAAGLLRVTLPAREGQHRSVRFDGALPGGLKATLSGSLAVQRLPGLSPPVQRQPGPSRTGR